jgi:hypothetical protein
MNNIKRILTYNLASTILRNVTSEQSIADFFQLWSLRGDKFHGYKFLCRFHRIVPFWFVFVHYNIYPNKCK